MEGNKYQSLRGSFGHKGLEVDAPSPGSDPYCITIGYLEPFGIGRIYFNIGFGRHNIQFFHFPGHGARMILKELPPRGQYKRIFFVGKLLRRLIAHRSERGLTSWKAALKEIRRPGMVERRAGPLEPPFFYSAVSDSSYRRPESPYLPQH